MRPQHRGAEGDRAAPHGGDPAEDLHARGHGDHHRRGDEVALHVERQAGGVHVVCPHDEADAADGDHRVDHRHVAEDRLAAEGRDDVADDAKARQDQDVHFGVAEEPEQVLEQDRVAAAVRGEEGRAEIAVG